MPSRPWLFFLVFGVAAPIGCDKAGRSPQANENEYDMGVLEVGAIPSHTFVLRNPTDTPFTVTKVAPSCACHVVDLGVSSVVRPHQNIFFTYSLPPLSGGASTGRLIVETDSAEDACKRFVFSLIAAAKAITSTLRSISAEPEEIFIAGTGVDSSQLLTLTSSDPDLLDSFAGFDVSEPYINVTRGISAPGTLAFRVSLSDDAPAGKSLGAVVIRFDRPAQTAAVRIYSYRQSLHSR